MSATKWPAFQVLRYQFDRMTSWYRSEPFTPTHSRVHEHLKVEPTFRQDLIARGARQVIHGPKSLGRWQFFTGLLPFGPQGWCEGNDREEHGGVKITSLCLFAFTDNDEALAVFYFPRHYPKIPADRLRFARAFAEHVDHHGIPGSSEGG